MADEKNLQAETAPQHSKHRPRKKWPITLGVIVGILVVAGAGLFIWHEQPSFCGAICHTPMNEYVETYNAQPGKPGVDKLGFTVEDANSMLVVSHKVTSGSTCLDCHVPTMQEQISEAVHWVSGNYYDPLSERTLADLGGARGITGEQFCMNDACHTQTRDDLKAATADMGSINPHLPQHGDMDCGYCHKAHRASVMQCAGCHEGAQIPPGWVTPQEAEDMGYPSDKGYGL